MAIYVVLNWWYGEPVFGHLAINDEGTVLTWPSREEATKWAKDNLTGNHQVILLEEPVGGNKEEPMLRFVMGRGKCPYCAEDIKPEAVKCKHCGSMLTDRLP